MFFITTIAFVLAILGLDPGVITHFPILALMACATLAHAAPTYYLVSASAASTSTSTNGFATSTSTSIRRAMVLGLPFPAFIGLIAGLAATVLALLGLLAYCLARSCRARPALRPASPASFGHPEACLKPHPDLEAMEDPFERIYGVPNLTPALKSVTAPPPAYHPKALNRGSTSSGSQYTLDWSSYGIDDATATASLASPTPTTPTTPTTPATVHLGSFGPNPDPAQWVKGPHTATATPTTTLPPPTPTSQYSQCEWTSYPYFHAPPPKDWLVPKRPAPLPPTAIGHTWLGLGTAGA